MSDGGMNHQNFIELLELDIKVDIFSRLPIRTILICKCVCNSWLSLLESEDYVQYHLSKSAPDLVVQTYDYRCRIYEFEDWNILKPLELELSSFLGYAYPIRGSIDGLLLFINSGDNRIIHIVNPITREYIKINCSPLTELVTGFGVSRKTGEYKVIRMYGEYWKPEKCKVYTLGTGSWRSVSILAHIHHLEYIYHSFGAFFNGNLHWITYDTSDRVWISFFDLEYEHFGIFASPVSRRPRRRIDALGLSALDDCLWLCDCLSEDEVVIWRLKDYGNEKSWTKEFLISTKQDIRLGRIVVPVKVSKDGDSVVVSTDFSMFHYSRKTNDVVNVHTEDMFMASIVHCSSFLSLKRFVNENVFSF